MTWRWPPGWAGGRRAGRVAAGLGAASSSCSYAAMALARAFVFTDSSPSVGPLCGRIPEGSVDTFVKTLFLAKI
jgi:hypothetical protein